MQLLKLKTVLLDTLFPQFCLGCGKEGTILCQDCLSLIEVTEYRFCPFCKTPKRVFEKGKCPSHQGMALDGLFSAASYQQSLLKKLIVSFKYRPYLKLLAPPLAFLIIAHFYLSRNTILFNGENSMFIPVPLSKVKRKHRGFNQSELLTQELSSFFKIPLEANNLVKIRETSPQVGLSEKERKENIKGAFQIKNPPSIRGKRIFLVDDVFTTGSTMEEAARTLKKAGAKEVWGIVIAREPPL